MNTITILGRVGREPEMRTTANGTQVVSFPVADSKKVKGVETTTWFDCAVFGARGATLQQYVQKGDQIMVTGEMELQTFQKNDGTQGFKCAVIVSNFGFVGGNNRTTAPAQQPAQQPQQRQQPVQQNGFPPPSGKPAPPPQGFDDFDEDIPFS